MLGLKKKLENGSLRIAPVEFAKFTYQFRFYLKSIRKYLLVKTRIILIDCQLNSQLIYKSNQLSIEQSIEQIKSIE